MVCLSPKWKLHQGRHHCLFHSYPCSVCLTCGLCSMNNLLKEWIQGDLYLFTSYQSCIHWPWLQLFHPAGPLTSLCTFDIPLAFHLISHKAFMSLPAFGTRLFPLISMLLQYSWSLVHSSMWGSSMDLKCVKIPDTSSLTLGINRLHH